MADNVAIGPGGGGATGVENVAADEVQVQGTNPVAKVQYVKLVDGTLNGTDAIPGTSASGLKVDTELPAAAALADNTANPTVPGVAAFVMGWDGATWDRMPGNSATGLTVNGTVTANAGAGPWPVTDNAGSLTVDAPVGTPVAARLSDGAAFYDATKTGQLPAALGAGGGVKVDGSGTALPVSGTVAISGSVTVDTELPAAAALADNTANPTVPGVAAFVMGWDGATWDRVRGDGGSLFIQDGGNSITVDGTITANAGTGPWPVTDSSGVNVAAVKPASTAPAATDPALVVSISPNSTLSVSAGLTQARDETGTAAYVEAHRQNTSPHVLTQDEIQERQLDTIILLLQDIAMSERQIAADTVSGRRDASRSKMDPFQGVF